jgi:hypothetical protein
MKHENNDVVRIKSKEEIIKIEKWSVMSNETLVDRFCGKQVTIYSRHTVSRGRRYLPAHYHASEDSTFRFTDKWIRETPISMRELLE